MPDSNPSLMTIFGEALELSDPVARVDYLDRACGEDAELRRRVEALLAAHAGAGRFLEPGEPPSDVPPEVTGAFKSDVRSTAEMATGQHLPDGATATFGEISPVGRGIGLTDTVIAGRYALVEVIGEGGMGTVYKANQTEPVKRSVALKLIKMGMDSKAVLARFDTERQALALMDHPNIARVYDGGTTSSGQPFFVMELVNGLPITKYCDRERFPIRARLELFIAVCHAVQHAHQKGIIHRDLKPSNVLVTEVDGRPTPKVIDFGVAKATDQKLSDLSIVDTGAVVGTPSYMSPEQADPSSMDIDTRTDVYALGVILYELLVGLPPIDAKQFKRGAFLEMVRMVRDVDPPKPSTKLSTADALPNIAANRGIEPIQLKRALQGDLDWIVMKSLEKDRTHRYDTVNGFANDILRHLSCEPVLAAPPSRAYRLKKFVRKNRGAVVAVSVVVLALLVGIAGTTWGLIRADKEAGNARTRLGEAETARNDLEMANTKLIESQEELLKSSDSLLSSVARSLLRPLAVQVQPFQLLPPLNDQEIEPLWELASSKEARLHLRFVEVALQDPVSTQRLSHRAAVALQAAVGLNATRRKQVEELLGNRLQSQDIPWAEQENVAVCLAYLGNLDPSLAARTAGILSQAMSKTTDPNAQRALSQSLMEIVGRMEPREAVETAINITQAMRKTTNTIALRDLSESLSAVAQRMGPNESALTCGQAANTLAQLISKSMDPDSIRILSRSLAFVAGRMNVKDASEVSAILIAAMSKTKNEFSLLALSQVLSTVAARLQPEDASQVCDQAATILTQAMNPTVPAFQMQYLSDGLSAVVVHIDSKEAAVVAAALIQDMRKITNPLTLSVLAHGLAVVADRMERKEGSHICGEGMSIIVRVVSKTVDQTSRWNLSKSLSAVAVRLEHEDAMEVATAINQAISKTTDDSNLQSLLFLTQSLSVVAGRLEPMERAKTCHPAAIALTQAMNKATNPFDGTALSEGLITVAACMEPKEAAKACGQAVAAITQTMSKTTTPSVLLNLSGALSPLTAFLQPEEVTEAIANLTQAMSRTREHTTLAFLSRGLATVAARMEPKEAEQVCGLAAANLTYAMSKTTDNPTLLSLSQALSAVAARMKSKEAAKACSEAAAILMQAMSKTTVPSFLQTLSWGLGSVAGHMEPKEAALACGQAGGTIIEVMGKTMDQIPMQSLCQALSSIAAYMAPKDAAEVVSVITQIMNKTTLTSTLLSLSHGLSSVVPRMDPREAAVTLIHVMKKTTDQNTLNSLSQIVSVVAARMEPREAAKLSSRTAIILTQAMSKSATTNALRPWSLQSLWQGFSGTLSHREAFTTHELLMNATATVAILGTPLTALTLQQEVLKPMSLLPPQALVDILKNPFCVDEARRLVLQQLSRHYKRPFADQWEFVDYVHKNKLDLDLTTPPEQPRPAR